LPLIAEDLGNITPQVIGLRIATGIPGMKVLQFAFDGALQTGIFPIISFRRMSYTPGPMITIRRADGFDLPDDEKQNVMEYLGLS